MPSPALACRPAVADHARIDTQTSRAIHQKNPRKYYGNSVCISNSLILLRLPIPCDNFAFGQQSIPPKDAAIIRQDVPVIILRGYRRKQSPRLTHLFAG
jgi:hypothetical protein